MLNFLRDLPLMPAPQERAVAQSPAVALPLPDPIRVQFDSDYAALERVLSRGDRVSQDELIALLRVAVTLLTR